MGADRAYRAGLAIAPDNASLMNNLALSLALRGDAEAVSLLNRLVARPEASLRQRLNLALAYGLLGRPEAAAKVARELLDEASVQSNLAAYDRIRSLPDHAMRAAALGAFLAGGARGIPVN